VSEQNMIGMGSNSDVSNNVWFNLGIDLPIVPSRRLKERYWLSFFYSSLKQRRDRLKDYLRVYDGYLSYYYVKLWIVRITLSPSCNSYFRVARIFKLKCDSVVSH